eukprot:2177599-Pleurochrysis_carterae.AAC.2
MAQPLRRVVRSAVQDSVRRWAVRDGARRLVRKPPGGETRSLTAQGAGLREGDSARHRAARVA